MVGLQDRRAGPGRAGKLTGLDRPAVQLAAAGLSFGLDPLRTLGLAPADLDILRAVVEEASKRRVQHDERLADAIGHATARRVTSWLKTALKNRKK